ncbi:MAG TPA: type II toxin-antitoxin system PemK/MazF family toxin [Candidatus Binataceae bacterium]|nr:type II toxin-antitoxin system PemK/MazF family toxin [Candidatus Binataceae bacterium]
MTIRRGEIWLADLRPGRGTEPGKIRPVLVVQAQALLDAGHPSTLVAPLSTQLVRGIRILRVRAVAQGDLHEDSDVLIDQILAIDNLRFSRGPLVLLDRATMAHVDQALARVLGLADA